jgi:signal transduction histidine kinase
MTIFNTEHSIPENVIQKLIDIFAEQTSLPIAYYSFRKNQFIWSDKGIYSPLCLKINKKFPLEEDSECDKDHRRRCKTNECKIAICHAGLWNVSFPILVNKIQVGALICGQRRINDAGKDHSSWLKFSKYVDSVDKKDGANLQEQYSNTIKINEADLDTHLIQGLINIQELLFTWNMALMEEEKTKKIRIQQQAHELLLPIQSIVANAENLYNETTDVELKEIAKDVLEEIQKLAIYAENMRSALILENIDRPYTFKIHNIYRPLIESIELYQTEANSKGIVINNPVSLQENNFADIEMSLEHMTRAFKNLVQNAVKYSFRSTKEKDKYFINISGEPSGAYYKVIIVNYGIGILPDEISRGAIFSEGYRGILSGDRERTGSGMGLAEVKKIIEKHNGRIEVRSEKKTTGYKTSVAVFLPYKQKGI